MKLAKRSRVSRFLLSAAVCYGYPWISPAGGPRFWSIGGAFCPYCAAQLASFGRSGEALAKAGVAVAALSVDDEQKNKETGAEHKLGFPVGHSADAQLLAETLGCYLGDHGNGAFLQSSGFVLNPDGEVEVAVYSSGAIGRLTAPDVLGYVRHARGED